LPRRCCSKRRGHGRPRWADRAAQCPRLGGRALGPGRFPPMPLGGLSSVRPFPSNAERPKRRRRRRRHKLRRYHTMARVIDVDTEPRPPLPPFTLDTAIQKVRAAEDGWNSRDPERVARAYSLQSRWRNRAEFIAGREQIVALLRRKWNRELDYRL